MVRWTSEQLQERGLAYLARGDHQYVIGIDEVGFGSWAGPIVVCAAVVAHGWVDARVKDSKLLSPEQRRDLVENALIYPSVLHHCIMSHDSMKVDRMGVSKARDDLAVKAARSCLHLFPGAVVVMDGNQTLTGIPAVSICMPKADNLVPAVSAASNLAKVYRDDLMFDLESEYPGYDFANNVGYGTPKHQQGLKQLGVSPIHRRSYQNIKKLLQK